MAANTHTEPISTPKEMGLIKGLSKRNSQLGWERMKTKRLTETGLKLLAAAGGDVYEFGIQADLWAKAKGKTHIDEYTNKKGKTSQVHYNPNGKYIGTVNKLGTEPVDCYYNTPINRELHIFNAEKLCFEPRESPPTPDPEPPKKKKVIKRK